MNTHQFYCNCINWPEDEMNLLIDITENAKEISREEFLDHVYINDQMLNLIPVSDNTIVYFKSVVFGEPFYYFYLDSTDTEYIFRL